MGRQEAREIKNFPVDFPFSGNFPETIPAQAASTAITPATTTADKQAEQ